MHPLPNDAMDSEALRLCLCGAIMPATPTMIYLRDQARQDLDAFASGDIPQASLHIFVNSLSMAVSSEDGHKQALDTSSSLPRSSQEDAGPSGSASDYRGLNENGEDLSLDASAEKGLVFKIDLRLCTIAGILSSLNLIDSTLLSSASVTSLFDDLDLTGDRYSQAIWV